MKNKIILICGFIAIAATSGWHYGSYHYNDLPSKDHTDRVKPSGNSFSNLKKIDNNREVSSTAEDYADSELVKNHSAYFQLLLKDQGARNIYNRSMEIFKDIPEGEALSKWITLGIRLESSQEFADDFSSSLAQINKNPDRVVDKISAIYKGLAKEDVFIQSMLINIVHQLEISKEQKISFYTERLGDKFELDQNGDPTDSSLNISNSMAFLNQYEFDRENIRSKIESSLNDHREDKKSQEELAERFVAYFPEFETEIESWKN